MKFETKFNLNDHVWCMSNNKTVEVIISCIKIFSVNTDQDHMKYNARHVEQSVSWLDHTDLHEESLYNTKAELLDSL